MPRYLITGGAGFIGSAIARRLLQAGQQVDIVDNLSTGLRSNVPAAARFIEADLASPATVEQLPREPYAAIFHLAAQSSGAVAQQGPYEDFQVNAGATLLLARWCLERNVRRFLYASSMTVYGDGNRRPVDEAAVCRPIGYYGAAKLTSETYLQVAALQGLNPTVLRLYNVYGPGQNLANLRQGMASIYLAYLLTGGPVPVTGSLDRYRDFVHIDDVVDAFIAAAAIETLPFAVYNVGSGRSTTVRELLRLLVAALGLPDDHPIDEQPGQGGDVFGSVACIDRIRRDLDWQPKVPLAAGLAGMAAWARRSTSPEPA